MTGGTEMALFIQKGGRRGVWCRCVLRDEEASTVARLSYTLYSMNGVKKDNKEWCW